MKRLITESDILQLAKEGKKSLIIHDGDIITPSALDKIKVLKFTVTYESKNKLRQIKDTFLKFADVKKIAIGSDHTGFKLKSEVCKFLTEQKYIITDVGTFTEESCDYPDIAYTVAQKVAAREVDIGILIDATGIPSAIAANKIKGIRAATCYSEFSAQSAKEHNNANILVVGAKSLDEESIKSIIAVFLKTEFSGGRHQRRLDKIAEIEENHFKETL